MPGHLELSKFQYDDSFINWQFWPLSKNILFSVGVDSCIVFSNLNDLNVFKISGTVLCSPDDMLFNRDNGGCRAFACHANCPATVFPLPTIASPHACQSVNMGPHGNADAQLVCGSASPPSKDNCAHEVSDSLHTIISTECDTPPSPVE